MINQFISHVKWFVDSAPPDSVRSLEGYEFMLIVATVLGAVFFMRRLTKSGLYHKFDLLLNKRLDRYKQWAPTVVRWVLGLSLILSSWNNYFWSPDVQAYSGLQTMVVWLLGGLGVILVAGAFVRLSALTLLILFFISLFDSQWLHLFEHLEYAGLGAYLMLAGGGKYAIERLDRFDFHFFDRYRHLALVFLRLGVGLSLVTLAFSEKLADIGLAQEFLNSHDWNFLSFIGANDRFFILFAGTMELIFGLALIFNILPRLVSFAILGLFTLTAMLLGIDEVIGHLFGLGLVAALWLNYPRSAVKKRFHP